MSRLEWDNLEQEARHLVTLNHAEVPSILESYIFSDPENKTIRIVHVDGKAFPEDSLHPILFAPDPRERLFHPMLIAVIDAEGVKRLKPPAGWGRWDGAIVVERRRRHKAS